MNKLMYNKIYRKVKEVRLGLRSMQRIQSHLMYKKSKIGTQLLEGWISILDGESIYFMYFIFIDTIIYLYIHTIHTYVHIYIHIKTDLKKFQSRGESINVFVGSKYFLEVKIYYYERNIFFNEIFFVVVEAVYVHPSYVHMCLRL